MPAALIAVDQIESRDRRFVSGRFLSEFFSALKRQGIEPLKLLGDLPIALGDDDRVLEPVEWSHFTDYMRRLELEVGGPAGLERIGELSCDDPPSSSLRFVAGFATSPQSLYRAASLWALRRAMPGLVSHVKPVEPGRIEVRLALPDEFRECPQFFHFAAGAARALPKLVGLAAASVSARVDERVAHYRITLPPSATLLARLRRFFSTIFSAGAILRFLETQQLELHAKHDALQRAHHALAESEERLRAMTDSAADVLAEVDRDGRILYVSASIEDLIGYSPEQVTGSHFRLWLPQNQTELVSRSFECHRDSPAGHTTREQLRLHAIGGRSVAVEMTARSYESRDGQWRLVCIVRRLASEATLESVRPRTRDSGQKASSQVDGPNANPKLGFAFDLEHDLGNDLDLDVSALVDGALAASPVPASRHQWVEISKLVETVRGGLQTHARTAGAHVEFDLSNAPEKVWTEEASLATGLARLVDWAASRGVETAPVEVTIATVFDPLEREAQLVALRVVASAIEGEPTRESEVSASIAESTAASLGGRLRVEPVGSREARTIELPVRSPA